MRNKKKKLITIITEFTRCIRCCDRKQQKKPHENATEQILKITIKKDTFNSFTNDASDQIFYVILSPHVMHTESSSIH